MLKIITITTGDIIFLNIQLLTLNKYIKEPFEFIIINACVKKNDFSNSNNTNAFTNVKNFCQNYNLTFLNFMNDEEQLYYDNLTEPSSRHAFILKKTVAYMKNNPDEYLNIDSDMFLINDFDIEEYRKYNCAVVLQQNNNVKYIWGGLFYFNITKMKKLQLLNHFDNGTYNNTPCDTGGGTYEWINSVADIYFNTTDIRQNDYDYFNKNGIKFIKHLWSCSWNDKEFPNGLNNIILEYCKNDFRNVNNNYYCEIYDNKFFHYRAGSNWNNYNQELHKILKNKLFNIVTNIIL
jgi:hypothetical protein